MSNTSLFLDANVILEALLPGRKNARIAQKFIENPDSVISPLSAHLYVYFGQKEGFDTQTLLANISLYSICSLDYSAVNWATENCINNDFEDALQVACAVLSGCKSFVTFDRKLASAYQSHINFTLLP